jgi:hypothetical protein
VTFGEDDSRIRQRNVGLNMALLRRVALSLLKQHPGKGSIATKRYEATLDPTMLEEMGLSEILCQVRRGLYGRSLAEIQGQAALEEDGEVVQRLLPADDRHRPPLRRLGYRQVGQLHRALR